jgi:hypothetical protein
MPALAVAVGSGLNNFLSQFQRNEPMATEPGNQLNLSGTDIPYGPGVAADETRQAQQVQANDTPTDVNMNAVVARSQALTVDMAGKGFTAMQERRQILADEILKKA